MFFLNVKAFAFTDPNHVDDFDFSASETISTTVKFSPDGKTMFVIGVSSDTLRQYSLGTAFDLSSSPTLVHEKFIRTIQNAAQDMAKELEKGLKDKFKNPYGEYRNPSTNDYKSDNAVTRAGWGQDRDLGYTIIDSKMQSGKAILNIHTCNKLPCSGDQWNNTNDNIEICLIEMQP